MVRLTIDDRPVEVPEGTTVLAAARSLGIEIPTMCFVEGWAPATSCMVCVVRIQGNGALSPACACLAQEGMVVWTNTPEVQSARRAALELLLGEHVGDCEGPCRLACPAGMNIPLMARQIARGRLDDAIATIKRDLALPSVLGRICPGPCEKPCRRAQADAAVAIRLLHGSTAEADLAADRPYMPPCMPASGRRVAIVGAGPAGLSAAFHLLQLGHGCTLFEQRAVAGGGLLQPVEQGRLPERVLRAETAAIERLGARFEYGRGLGRDFSLRELQDGFDAVLLACGDIAAQQADKLGLPASAGGLKADRSTFRTDIEGVFAAGNCVRGGNKLAVVALAGGKHAAACIDQHLRGRPVEGAARPFNVSMGRLEAEELAMFLAGASPAGRAEASASGVLPAERLPQEAARCLHCDCRKADGCKLRRYAGLYQADGRRYRRERRRFFRQADHSRVVYEAGKCIKCGICVRLASARKEPLGLAFIGRGFDVHVGVPFEEGLAGGLRTAAEEVVRACPTGALAFKEP